MAYNSEKTKANREYYLRNGRCPRCGGANPVEPGRNRCRECALKSSNARREQRIKRREDRRCTRCGKPLPEDSRYIQCNECRTYLRKYQVFNKARYEQLKAEGRCVKCGEWAAQGKRCAASAWIIISQMDKVTEIGTKNRNGRGAICTEPMDGALTADGL